MKFNELSDIMQKPEPKPDTYEAGMALNQLLKIGTHAIKIHNMIDDGAEMEAWVAKKIDLASNYVKSVHGYTAGSKAGTYDDNGMTEDAGDMDLIGDGAENLGLDPNKFDYYYDTSGAGYGEVRTKSGKAILQFEYDRDGDAEVSTMDNKTIANIKQGEQLPNNVTAKLNMIKEDAGDKYFDFENSDEYADNVEKYGDVDKTPLTPQERQQFKKWLIDTANDYSSMALDGVEEIGDDLSDIEDQYHKFIPKIKEYLKKAHATQNIEDFASDVLGVEEKFGDEDLLMNDEGYRVAKDHSQHAMNYESGLSKLKSKGQDYTVKTIRGVLDLIDDDPHIASAMLVFQQDFEGTPLQKKVSRVQASESVSEDAGEGHMSKSQLYQTAKMAIELLDMIKKGDDLEGWVQTKLNLAADYLQAVYHYEDYQKLNPYREEIDGALVQKHAGIIQKHLDEILARETETADVDTKPGMMKILKKRVNEVEKEMAKENRKETDEVAPPGREKQVKKLKGKFKDKGAPYAIAWAQHNKHGKPKKEADINERMPASVIKHKEKLAHMSDEELANRFKDFDEQRLRQMAWRHGYGKMSSHYLDRVRNHMTSKRTGTTEAELEEGLKDWAKNLAMAGVIVAGLAGVGSINDAIDRSIPAVQAMETALELAQDQGNTELADMIKKDLSAVKVRLSSGKDLNFVKGMQEKYAKFIQTEGLAYESRLQVQLNQQLK